MREIKFRGKRVDKEEFAFGDLLTGMGYKEGRFFILPHLSYYPSDCHSVDGYEVKPETIGQFTGLMDKNGKEIYEGDIVKSISGKIGYVIFLRQEMGYVVVWDNCDTRLGHRNRGGGYGCDGSIEVIGNVHDNPELLTKQSYETPQKAQKSGGFYFFEVPRFEIKKV